MELSLKSLEEAVSIRRQMEGLQRRLNSIFGGSSSTGTSRRSGRRTMSPATRAKLSAAAKARWAKRKGSGSSKRASGKKKGGGLTAAGRRRLSQLMKARWAARRRGKK